MLESMQWAFFACFNWDDYKVVAFGKYITFFWNKKWHDLTAKRFP